MDHLKITIDKLSVEEITDLVTDDVCGAISLFIGTTRDNFEGKKVLRLEYEAYEAMALKAMKSICDEARAKWPALHGIAIYHRLGQVKTREASVVIAVSSPHRKDSLTAVSFCIEELKSKVPIWKKEVYESEEAVWKENPECVKIKEEPFTTTATKEDEDKKEIAKVNQESETDIKPKTESEPTIEQNDDIDKSLIQLNVSHEELQRRIQKFIESKREQVNLSNVHDFLPNKGQGDDSCARVQTQFVRRSDSKGHLKIHRVFNEWGPQTAKAKMRVLEDDGGLPIGIAERVTDIEKYLNINPVSKDIFQRLKDMENRIAVLESVSPEYKSFWKQNSAESCTDNTETKSYVFSSDDITRKIEQLEQESYEHY